MEWAAEAHEYRQKVTPAQEIVLKDWIKAMGVRGIPLTPAAVAEYASIIIDQPVSDAWARKFRARHKDLKAKWTTGLEACQAKALNQTQVTEFYGILHELIMEYDVKMCDIHNMDKKGIQLGMGQRSLVLVDRDKKTVQQVEDRNWELVTVIECICTDGSFLPPSVIYKGKRQNLEW